MEKCTFAGKQMRLTSKGPKIRDLSNKKNTIYLEGMKSGFEFALTDFVGIGGKVSELHP